MKKKTAFTLAEVLIALVIIGVIAAMTIPTLLNNTNAQEYRTALKKSIAVLNQAITMHYALEGTTVDAYASGDTSTGGGPAGRLVTGLFNKRLNVVNFSTNAALGGGYAGAGTASVYTADGIKYSFKLANAGCAPNNQLVCYDVYIDVNGDRKPNILTDSKDRPRDGYVARMYAQRVIPGTGAANDVTQAIMYDQGLYYD